MKDKLLKHIDNYAVRNANISNWSVGEHLDHIWNVIHGINLKLKNSNSELESEKFSIAKAYVLLFKRIPRGRGKSPKEVMPDDEVILESLIKKIDDSILFRSEMENLNINAWFLHSIFGVLKLKNAIKFVDVHTNHHLAIIDDIQRMKR